MLMMALYQCRRVFILPRGPLRPSDLKKEALFLTTWDFKYSLLMGFEEKSNLEKMVRGDKEAIPLKDHFGLATKNIVYLIGSRISYRSIMIYRLQRMFLLIQPTVIPICQVSPEDHLRSNPYSLLQRVFSLVQTLPFVSAVPFISSFYDIDSFDSSFFISRTRSIIAHHLAQFL
jgi:hypothetical protein